MPVKRVVVSAVAAIFITIVSCVAYVPNTFHTCKDFDILFSVLGVLFLPGDMVSIILCHNFHDESIVLAVCANLLIYTAGIFFVWRLAAAKR
jgi:hypothetical protein